MMRILSESQNYILGHEYEQVILINKSNNSRTEIGDHYGDPVAGLISPEEDWFVTAGEGILFFNFKRGLRPFLREGFKGREPYGDGVPVVVRDRENRYNLKQIGRPQYGGHSRQALDLNMSQEQHNDPYPYAVLGLMLKNEKS